MLGLCHTLPFGQQTMTRSSLEAFAVPAARDTEIEDEEVPRFFFFGVEEATFGRKAGLSKVYK